jgi:hypothetical protein
MWDFMQIVWLLLSASAQDKDDAEDNFSDRN